ncbi:MAG: hypothetical protein H6623_00495 [Bdellovibrionaceae bacterium]|nr:hypothetical protein [Pseudobdellovibrionaceae bacterium]
MFSNQVELYQKRVRPYLGWTLIIAIIFLVYSNVYHYAFVYDDEFFIVKNKFLQSWSNILDIFTSNSTAGSGFKDSFYRPIQFFIYLIVYQLFGADVVAFHFLNVLIHTINALLIYRFSQKLGFTLVVSCFVALLWAVHPVHVEVVTYMSGTGDLLYSFFLLLGLNIMLPTMTAKRMIVGWFCFLFALLSKETGVLGVTLLTAGIFYFSEKRFVWRSYLKTLPFWLMSLAYAVLRKTILNFDGDFAFFKQQNIYSENILYRIYTFLATLPSYLKVLLWPEHLSIDRPFPVYTDFWYTPVTMGTAMLLSALAIPIVLWRYRQSWGVWSSFVVLWFAGAHFLHSGIVMPLNSFFLEHWLYLSSVSFFLMGGSLISQLLSHNKILKYTGFTSITGLIFFSGWRSYQQSEVWQSPITLFTHILEQNPSVARARHGLAMAYSDHGELNKAIEQYEIALRDQKYPQTYHNMGIIFLQQNQVGKAEESFLQAIQLSPDFYPSYSYLAHISEIKNEPEKVNTYKELYQKYAPH